MAKLLKSLMVGALLFTGAGAVPLVDDLTPKAMAADGVSLVFQGKIYDVDRIMTPKGRYLSLSGVANLLKDVGGFSLQTRPDRGHVVIAEVEGGTVTTPANFSRKDLTLVVGTATFSLLAEVKNGVPHITSDGFRSVLEALNFNIEIDDAATLIAVSRRASAPVVTEGGGDGSASGMPGAGFQEMVLQGTGNALQAMGMGSAPTNQDAAQGRTVASAASSQAVCASMDQLRYEWHITEPSAQEKATFKRLADTFQNMQPDQLDSGAVDDLMDGLKSFKVKVDQRSTATKAWDVSAETTQVRKYGVQFMDLYQKTMDAMIDTTDQMQNGGSLSYEELNGLKDQLQEMESQIHGLGSLFNAEVRRVRSVYGCGPATLKGSSS